MRHLLIALLLLGALPARGAPPAPWQAGNIGLASRVGQVEVDARGIWSVHAATIDAPYVLDSLFLIHRPLAGDGSILALLLSQAGGHAEWGQAGVSLLASDVLRPRAVHLHMSTGHGVAFGYRTTAGAAPVTETGDGRYGVRRFPIWLRIQREGERFTPFSSNDGFGWSQLRAPLAIPGFPREALAAITAASGRGEPVRALLASPLVSPGLLSPLVTTVTGNGEVQLDWPPVAGAAGYLVRRGAPDQPGFAAEPLTRAPIRETTFTDLRLPNDRAVRYLVSAVFEDAGQLLEGWATAVVATPRALPEDLLVTDIGHEATQLHGSITFDPYTRVATISGTGRAPDDAGDHCFYAFRPLVGDFTVSARMEERPARTGGAVAGVMARESLAAPARRLFLAGTVADGLSPRVRRQAGGPSLMPDAPALLDRDFEPPLWLRIVRRGNALQAFFSRDGAVWVPAGPSERFDPPLPERLYAGYAVYSGDAGVPAVSTFRDLTFAP